jgi:hypothetical protein
MKKQHIITLLTAILFVTLFYQQAPALNILIFSVLLATGLFVNRQKQAKMALTAFIASAVAVYIYGNALSVITCFIFFVILAGKISFSHLPTSFALLPGFLKLLTAFPMNITRIISYKSNHNAPAAKEEQAVGKLLQFSLTAVALLVFFFLYAQASTGFSMMLDSISFNIPNFDFWLILMMSCFISHAIFYTHGKSLWKHLVPSLKENLEPSPAKSRSSWLSLGSFMFAALSTLAFVVICSDLYYIISGSVGAQDPAFYSRLVHEGVAALMFSIFIAIILLLAFFEGRINFLPKNARAKRWAYAWIICNVAMICLTYYKNGLYVQESGLTYRRIGVWYYLLACGIVLSFVFFKIRDNMNFLYLIRKSCSFCLLILLISTCIPWEFAVTSFNIRQAEKQGRRPDIAYLMSLDGHNLHMILDYIKGCQVKATEFAPLWNPVYENILQYQTAHQQKHWLSIPLTEYYSIIQLQDPNL